MAPSGRRFFPHAVLLRAFLALLLFVGLSLEQIVAGSVYMASRLFELMDIISET